MKMDKEFPEKVRNVSEKDLLHFYFFESEYLFVMYDRYLSFDICIENIVVEGTVSQIVYICPGSFSIRFRK